MFLNIRRWCDVDVIRVRHSWINIYGIPLHGWNEANFTSIGNKVGKVIKVDSGTVAKKALEHGKVLIETWQWERINVKVVIEINKKRFPVWIAEGSDAISSSLIPKFVDCSDSEEVSSDSKEEEMGDLEGDRVEGRSDMGVLQEECPVDRGEEHSWTRTPKKNISWEHPKKHCVSSDMHNHEVVEHAQVEVSHAGVGDSVGGSAEYFVGPTESKKIFFEGQLLRLEVQPEYEEHAVLLPKNSIGLASKALSDLGDYSGLEEVSKNFNNAGNSFYEHNPNHQETVDTVPLNLGPLIEGKQIRERSKQTTNSNRGKTKLGKKWEEFMVDMASEKEFSESTQVEKKKKGKQKKSKRSKASSTDNHIQRCNEAFWKRRREEKAVANFENNFM